MSCDVLTVAKQLGIVAAEAPSSSLDETDSVLLEEGCLKRYGAYQERQLRHAAAAKGYQDAAEQGDADAQFNLGVCYDKGQGVPRDDAEALKWICRAAEQGHADAFNLLVQKADFEERWRKALPALARLLFPKKHRKPMTKKSGVRPSLK